MAADTKRRVAIASTAMERCDQFLRDSHVAKASGRLAKEALSLMDLLYVPNTRDGLYDIRDLDETDERIPFIVAAPGEHIGIAREPSRVVHPRQWNTILKKIDKIDVDEVNEESAGLIRQWIAETCQETNGDVLHLTVNPYACASVWAEAGAISISRKKDGRTKLYGVESRPIVIGNAKLLEDPEVGSLLYHELIHVMQFFRGDTSVFVPGPKRKWSDRRAEIEAYSHQAVAEEAYYDITAEENPYSWNSMAIEAIRRTLNDGHKDPYRVSKRMMRLFESQNIRIEI